MASSASASDTLFSFGIFPLLLLNTTSTSALKPSPFQYSIPQLHSQEDSPPLLAEDASSLLAFFNPQNYSWNTLKLIELILSHLFYQNSHISFAYLILPLSSLNV